MVRSLQRRSQLRTRCCAGPSPTPIPSFGTFRTTVLRNPAMIYALPTPSTAWVSHSVSRTGCTEYASRRAWDRSHHASRNHSAASDDAQVIQMASRRMSPSDFMTTDKIVHVPHIKKARCAALPPQSELPLRDGSLPSSPACLASVLGTPEHRLADGM